VGAEPIELGRARWPQLAGGCDLVLLPTGSCEQHGPHLPFRTDAAVAEAVAGRAAGVLAAEGVRVVVAPTLPYGASGEHQHFPGTVDIGHVALRAVLVELGRSIGCWGPRLVFVNGHGGNVPSLRDAVLLLRREGRDVAWVPCVPPGSDAHAGRTETSLMASLDPGSVRADLAERGNTRPVEQLMPRLRREGVIAVSPNGVLGDPGGATATEGGLLLRGLVEETVRVLRSGRHDAEGRLRSLAGAPA
jgi:mycofactocin system creatininase family protein